MASSSKPTATKLREDQILDNVLKERRLIRKKIPMDGACLFRAIADCLLPTQLEHNSVRQHCVDYLASHKDDFEPFVCVGIPWEDYLQDMRKINTWGGEAELQALSLSLKVDFEVHTANNREPVRVGSGSDRLVRLSYYGNHYDRVLTEEEYNTESACQSLLYQVLHQILDLPPPENTEYINLGWEHWLAQNTKQIKKDEKLIDILSKPSSTSGSVPVIPITKNKKKKNKKNNLITFKLNTDAPEPIPESLYSKFLASAQNIDKNLVNDDPDLFLTVKAITETERKEVIELEFPTLPTLPKTKVPEKISPLPAGENIQADSQPTETSDTQKTEPEVPVAANPWGIKKNWADQLDNSTFSNNPLVPPKPVVPPEDVVPAEEDQKRQNPRRNPNNNNNNRGPRSDYDRPPRGRGGANDGPSGRGGYRSERGGGPQYREDRRGGRGGYNYQDGHHSAGRGGTQDGTNTRGGYRSEGRGGGGGGRGYRSQQEGSQSPTQENRNVHPSSPSAERNQPPPPSSHTKGKPTAPNSQPSSSSSGKAADVPTSSISKQTTSPQSSVPKTSLSKSSQKQANTPAQTPKPKAAKK